MEIESTSPKIRTHRSRLTQEIIEKILPKLPVKSLLRFRCVSKLWLSLITHKLLTKTHHQNSIKNPSFPHQRVILHSKSYRPMQCSLHSLLHQPPSLHHLSPFDVPINIRRKPLQVVGCYDGLMCILEQPRTFFLWNPSTRISKRLPRLQEVPKTYKVMSYGFGWVESSREYKVFGLLFGPDNEFVLSAVVYSSITKDWKTVGKLRGCMSCEEGVFVDGKLHWLNRGNYIVTFDLKNEVFDEIMVPYDGIKEKPFNKGLGVVGGCLSVLYYYIEAGIRVWVTKECGRWERLATFRSVLELLERPFSTPFILSPKGEIVLFSGSTFLIYYPRDNVFRCPEIFCRYQSHHLYVESLVSPEAIV